MRKIVFIILAAFFATAATAQKVVNDPNAQNRNLSGFHAITVEDGIDLYLSQGDEAVAVSASETKYRDKIQTEVVNGVLKITYGNDKGIVRINWTTGKMKLKAYVSFKNIDKLNASGGSDVLVDGSIKVSKLDLGLSGGSDFKGKVDVSSLKAGASGGSDINISGTAQTIDIDVSGGSDFSGYDLAVENCKVDASGGSDVYITVNKELNVDASGGSDVRYKGTALIRDIRSSGGGSVKKASK